MNRTRLLLSLAALSLFSLAERSFAQSLAPVSGGDRLSASAAGGSFLPVFSQDAYTIVYLSHANNLVTNDDSSLALDVFGYNLRTDQNELSSLNTSRRGGGDADATHAGDGYVES